MKITSKIERAIAEDRCFWERMYTLGPEFIDVTWAAGGGSSELTMQICATAQAVYGLEACMHLTCTNMPREKIDTALREAHAAGIQNILALRGDPPRGQENWTKVDTGFAYATDLVKYIRKQYGDYFCIGVAGYPEGHIENSNEDQDFKNFIEKCEAGADYIVTQLFYDVDIFLKWLKRVRDAGVMIPVLPGIMPIQSYGGFKRMTTLSKTAVPKSILEGLEPIKDDDKAVKDFGVKIAVEMCNTLKDNGIRGFHFYCLNLERSVRLILEGLGFIAPIEVAKPLPWNPSLDKKREKETVRPIFWRNRTRSYILRTEAWDDFPNGRWGDARSPAYGDLDGYGVSLKWSRDEAKTMWGQPKQPSEINEVFAKFCKNEIDGLPWCSQPLALESSIIRSHLINVNMKGYLTINSQPAVDGVLSSDPNFGWGPKNGFVYQKAYLEFFVSPDVLDKLIAKINAKFPSITYHAVNRQGDLKTNCQGDGPNAVTWGVFPGQEILQPTVVDPVSFMAWKDEAMELWAKWRDLYPDGSDSFKLIDDIYNNWFLMNIVDNNFKNPEGIFEIFA